MKKQFIPFLIMHLAILMVTGSPSWAAQNTGGIIGSGFENCLADCYDRNPQGGVLYTACNLTCEHTFCSGGVCRLQNAALLKKYQKMRPAAPASSK
jgi:hypothetical protein